MNELIAHIQKVFGVSGAAAGAIAEHILNKPGENSKQTLHNVQGARNFVHAGADPWQYPDLSRATRPPEGIDVKMPAAKPMPIDTKIEPLPMPKFTPPPQHPGLDSLAFLYRYK